MSEKQQIIKDFLEDWYDMNQFHTEHPDLKSVYFKTIPQFLEEVQLAEDDNMFDVETMFLHWVQNQYAYSKSKAEAIVSIVNDFNNEWNQKSNTLNKKDYLLQVSIYKDNLVKIIKYKVIDDKILDVIETPIEFA